VAAHARVRQAWQKESAELDDMLDEVGTFRGESAAEVPGFVGRKGERVYLVGSGAGLIEPRVQQGHWESGSQGFSFRVAKGVSYRIGQTRGHYIPGPETLTAIDSGRVLISDQRIVFQGDMQAREWAYAKLVGYHHDETGPWTSLHESNRQKTSAIHYDATTTDVVRFRLALALAVFQGDTSALEGHIRDEIDAHRASEPAL
jgi:hypothetical protein